MLGLLILRLGEDRREKQRLAGEMAGTRIVVVGDVSGKGLRAAMLVSLAIGILRNERTSSPARILSVLNEGLMGRSGDGFVTCCCARFDRGRERDDRQRWTSRSLLGRP